MSLGPIMLDLEGVELTEEEIELLQNSLVGGVILLPVIFLPLIKFTS